MSDPRSNSHHLRPARHKSPSQRCQKCLAIGRVARPAVACRSRRSFAAAYVWLFLNRLQLTTGTRFTTWSGVGGCALTESPKSGLCHLGFSQRFRSRLALLFFLSWRAFRARSTASGAAFWKWLVVQIPVLGNTLYPCNKHYKGIYKVLINTGMCF